MLHVKKQKKMECELRPEDIDLITFQNLEFFFFKLSNISLT